MSIIPCQRYQLIGETKKMTESNAKVLYRKRGLYEKYIKRILDILCALAAIIVFCWLYIIVAVLVRIKLGSPVIFKQQRPGLIDPKTGQERIFAMYKFRSMTNEKDKDGNFLPDEQRLSRFGMLLRGSSMDELPEAFNILKGDMSVIGPRPQLVRDMVFMTNEQRKRHTARPGLSGLAQASGRNALTWENKLNKDLEYIKHITFMEDVRIIMKTIGKVFLNQKEVGLQKISEVDIVEDLGDYLLKTKQITEEQYRNKQKEAEAILNQTIKIHV